MVKLITPIGMLITVALLAIYAAYAFWTAYVHIEYLPDHLDEAWIYGSLGALSLVACYGTAMLRPWSRYLVYVLTALFIAGWCYSVYSGAAVGYFSVFVPSRVLVAKALAPGLALVVLSCLASLYVFNHFRGARLRVSQLAD
jgi:hypothetical protein